MTNPATAGGLRKVRRTTFVQVPSSTIDDATLSFRARGVLAWLLDKPDGWDVRAEVIASRGLEGREAIEKALRELRAAGYYRLERRRLAGGTFAMGTAIAEEPVPEWAAAHEAHHGAAVAVHVLEDGTVVEDVPPAQPRKRVSGVRSDGSRSAGPRSAGSPTQTDTQTETQGGDVPGVRHQGAGPVDEPLPDVAPLELPPARCAEHADAPATGPCPACGDARRARAAAEERLEADRRRRVEAERAAAAEARRLADTELTSCNRCDDAGIALVVLPLEGTHQTVCQHDHERNAAAVRGRLAARASTAAALDPRRKRKTTPQPQEA